MAAAVQAGRVSTKESDFLEQDDPIRGQNYVCVSFVSPEDALKTKEVFVFSEFTKHFSTDVTLLLDNLKLKFEGNEEIASMIKCVKDRHDYMWTDEAMQNEYQHFKDTNSGRLESEFYEKNNFNTSIRGFKVRGVYESDKEARMRVEQLRRKDTNHNIFIAQVGCWCPWSPNPGDIADQEYAETELNTLMKKYRENLDARDQMYQDRFDTLKSQAEADAQAQREATEKLKAESADVQSVENSEAKNTLESLEGADPWMTSAQKQNAPVESSIDAPEKDKEAEKAIDV